MFLKVLLLATVVLSGYSKDSFGNVTVMKKDKILHWTTLGKKADGFKLMDLRKVQIQEGNTQTSLNAMIRKSKKTKAVLQVIDMLKSGGVCGGCVSKGNFVTREIKKDKKLDKETIYIMIISGNATPSQRTIATAKRFVDKGVIVVGDINGAFQKKFGTGKFPVTLVLDSGYRGKLLNMHKGQYSLVTRTLKNLPK